MTSRLRLQPAWRGFALGLVLLGSVAAAPGRAQTPQVTDGAHDAYRQPGTRWGPPHYQTPQPDLSDSAADIRSVVFENSSSALVYTVTIALQAAPDGDHNYIAGGDFGSGCVIYHIMTPTTLAEANIFCGRNSEFTDSFVGSLVEVKGEAVLATFAYQSTQIPPAAQLEDEITGLFALTCRSADGSRGCTSPTTLDWAEAPAATFRI